MTNPIQFSNRQLEAEDYLEKHKIFINRFTET